MKKRIFFTAVTLIALLFIFTGSCGNSKVSGATVSLLQASTLPPQSLKRDAQEFFQRGFGDIRAFGAKVRQH